jgi:GntR family transcriptional repressor for pyruvate dehydrogenase complex
MAVKQEPKLKRAPLYEQIANTLEEFIINEGVEEMRLPSEFELAQQYQVSRTVIREALKILKERGLVSMRVGDGLYTTRPKYALSSVMNRIVRFDHIDDAQIASVRQILEEAACLQALRYADERDFDLLETINQSMEAAKEDYDRRAALDYQFHYTLAKIGKNELLTDIIESIMDILQDYIKRRLTSYPSGNQQGIEEHALIIKTLRQRDSDKAVSLIRNHLKASYRQYKKNMR